MKKVVTPDEYVALFNAEMRKLPGLEGVTCRSWNRGDLVFSGPRADQIVTYITSIGAYLLSMYEVREQ